MNELFSVVGVVVVGVVAIAATLLGGRWIWHKIPGHASHEGDILQRLSEIVVVLVNQTEVLRKVDTKPGEAVALLLEIRSGVKDQVEALRMIAEQTHKSVEDARADATDTLFLKSIAGHVTEIFEAVRPLALTLDTLKRIEEAVTWTDEEVEWEEIDHRNLQRIADISVKPRADLQGLIAKLDEFQLFIKNENGAFLTAIDTLVLDFGKFQKQQANLMNVLFNGGSVTSVDDEKAAEMERIEALMRRYGISRELAEERVRRTAVYEPSAGRTTMRG